MPQKSEFLVVHLGGPGGPHSGCPWSRCCLPTWSRSSRCGTSKCHWSFKRSRNGTSTHLVTIVPIVACFGTFSKISENRHHGAKWGLVDEIRWSASIFSRNLQRVLEFAMPLWRKNCEIHVCSPWSSASIARDDGMHVDGKIPKRCWTSYCFKSADPHIHWRCCSLLEPPTMSKLWCKWNWASRALHLPKTPSQHQMFWWWCINEILCGYSSLCHGIVLRNRDSWFSGISLRKDAVHASPCTNQRCCCIWPARAQGLHEQDHRFVRFGKRCCRATLGGFHNGIHCSGSARAGPHPIATCLVQTCSGLFRCFS